ncbi:MAG: energy transducer TonB [Ignavibacteriaceae bacterium]|nr:energy transducer TonB [Ignavibacteriaceae bacterium]NUM70645.1 energy transducer TonB [Ignavibacteriaceae bacterium]
MKTTKLITIVIGLFITGTLFAGNVNPERRVSERLKLAATWQGAGDSIYAEVDKYPEIIGGIESIIKKVVYPENAKKNGTEGTVFLGITVDEQGNIIKTEVLKSVDKELDNAALAAVKSVKFTPGEKGGKKVKVKLTLPIAFKLNGADKKKDAKLDKDDVYITAEKMPEPVGGMEAILKRVVYPAEAMKKQQEGKVVLSTVINENGDATEIKVEKSVNADLDKAAVEALKGVKFTPGEQNGKKIKVKIFLPIMFKLK